MRNESRSENGSLREGATDGKYRKVRPDTTVADVAGDARMRQERVVNRQPFVWGPLNQAPASQVNPGA